MQLKIASAALLGLSLTLLSPAVGFAQHPPVQVTDHIYQAAYAHNVDANWLLRTAWCESKYDPNVTSQNKLYHGLYQFSWRTWNWMSAQAGYEGRSPYDPEAAAQTTAWAFANGHRNHWPRCSYA